MTTIIWLKSAISIVWISMKDKDASVQKVWDIFVKATQRFLWLMTWWCETLWQYWVPTDKQKCTITMLLLVFITALVLLISEAMVISFRNHSHFGISTNTSEHAIKIFKNVTYVFFLQEMHTDHGHMISTKSCTFKNKDMLTF